MQSLYQLCACILVIYDYFARTSTTNFYRNLQKILFTSSTSIGKCHIGIEIKPVHFVLAQFTQRRQWDTPHALILNIEGATDHSCLENCSGAKYKTFILTFLISNRIIFLLDQFQPHQPPVILTTRMLVSILQSLRTLLLKSTMVGFTSSLTGFF